MSDQRKFDERAPRVDRARLMEAPSAADLHELPPTTEADWADADLVIPIDEETYCEFAPLPREATQQGG